VCDRRHSGPTLRTRSRLTTVARGSTFETTRLTASLRAPFHRPHDMEGVPPRRPSDTPEGTHQRTEREAQLDAWSQAQQKASSPALFGSHVPRSSIECVTTLQTAGDLRVGSAIPQQPPTGHHGRHGRARLGLVNARRFAPPARCAASALTRHSVERGIGGYVMAGNHIRFRGRCHVGILERSQATSNHGPYSSTDMAFDASASGEASSERFPPDVASCLVESLATALVAAYQARRTNATTVYAAPAQPLEGGSPPRRHLRRRPTVHRARRARYRLPDVGSSATSESWSPY
jgi:hypothetical protein